MVNAAAPGTVSPSAQAVAPGLMVMAVIYFVGAVGGAHLNPAVTFSFALRHNFPWLRVPGYVVMQLIGATLAASFLRVVFGNIGDLGATMAGPGFTDKTAMVIEALLTLGLVSVVLGTASGARNIGTNAALAVGGYVALAGLWAAPVTGASMNPARSLRSRSRRRSLERLLGLPSRAVHRWHRCSCVRVAAARSPVMSRQRSRPRPAHRDPCWTRRPRRCRAGTAGLTKGAIDPLHLR